MAWWECNLTLVPVLGCRIQFKHEDLANEGVRMDETDSVLQSGHQHIVLLSLPFRGPVSRRILDF